MNSLQQTKEPQQVVFFVDPNLAPRESFKTRCEFCGEIVFPFDGHDCTDGQDNTDYEGEDR